MNLHGIASSAIGVVNPFTPMQIFVSTGSTTASDGKRTPTYAPVQDVLAQVQALSADDLHQMDGLNIQGQKRAVYVNGKVDGIVRPDNKGGDLVTWNGRNWLIVHVLEYWPDWCKFVITLQNP